MRAWVVRSDGEPRDVLAIEDVAEPTPGVLSGLRMDLAGWVVDPSTLEFTKAGVDETYEHDLFATRRTASAARRP